MSDLCSDLKLMYFLFLLDLFPQRNTTDQWIVKVAGMTAGWKKKNTPESPWAGPDGGFFILQEKKNQRKSHWAKPATSWQEWESLYIRLSLLLPQRWGFLWSCGETMTAYWGSRTATQEILINEAPRPHHHPNALLLGNRYGRPQTFCMYVCVWERERMCACGISGGATGRGADQGVHRKTSGLFY